MKPSLMLAPELQELSPREQKFCEEYFQTGHIRNSYISAGYSANGASTSGRKLLERPRIQSYIAALRLRSSNKALSRREKVLSELDKVAFANIKDLIYIDADGLPQIDFSNATEDQLAAVASVQTKRTKRYDAKGKHIATEDNAKFTMLDKLRGLEILAKVEGLLKPDEQKVVIDVADRLLAARQRVARLGAPEQRSNDDD